MTDSGINNFLDRIDRDKGLQERLMKARNDKEIIDIANEEDIAMSIDEAILLRTKLPQRWFWV